MINLNTFPYFDDFDSSKGFNKILFHPAKPVQARELTQIQSILQEQIKKHGDHMFKNGTVVIPGHLFYDNNIKFLKLESTYNQVDIENYLLDLLDLDIIGLTNKIEAVVMHVEPKTTNDPTTIYIKYKTSAGNINEFQNGEILECPSIAGLQFQVSQLTNYTGDGSICTIENGVYYINGYFVEVLKQTITTSKYDNKPSTIVGLDYKELIVTENEDESLYDNAQGFTNYGAPGSHRLKVSLTLTSKDINYVSTGSPEIRFIDLLKVVDGNIQFLKNNTDYAEFEKLLARRTYDESGDYVVEPFSFSVRNLRNNVRGTWTTNTPYLKGDLANGGNGIWYVAMSNGYSGVTIPSHTYGSKYDGSIYWNQTSMINLLKSNGKVPANLSTLEEHVDMETLMEIRTSKGKAYVKGFEVNKQQESVAIVDKARELKQLTSSEMVTPSGSYIIVNNVKGSPDISSNLSKVDLLDLTSTVIGTAYVKGIERTYKGGEFRLFLFSIKMNSHKNFKRDVVSVISGITFSADINSTVKQISGLVNITIATTTLNGVGTRFDYELKNNDRISVNGQNFEISHVTSPTSAEVKIAAVTGETNIEGYIETSELIKLGGYITRMPESSIASMRAEDGTSDTTYDIIKNVTFTSAGTTANITLSSGETFIGTGHTVLLDTGVLANDVEVDATYTLTTPTEMTIGGLVNATAYQALIAVKRVGNIAKEKSKSLTTKTIIVNDSGIYLDNNGSLGVLISSNYNFTSKVLSLTEADGVRLVKVTQSGDNTDKTNYVTLNESEITTNFRFNDGQRPDFYDVAKLSTRNKWTRPLRITFEYFSHTTGDYFNVDSYTSIPDKMIPVFYHGGERFDLSDCLDFRCRISDNGTEFNNTSGGSVSEHLISTSVVVASYSHYIPRVDEIAINSNGDIEYVMGGKIKDGMKLATINVPAYTDRPDKTVSFNSTQVRNYTMNEIGKIDNKVDNLEYLVTLTALENITVNSSITDSLGLEITKNGFLIDEFINHDVAAFEDSDYKCSVDMDGGSLRALATMEVISLIEPEGISQSTRNSSHYQLTGNMISLPYTETEMISQTAATRPEKIQSFQSLEFNGDINLFPNHENFYDNKFNVVVNNTNMADVVATINTNVYVYRNVKYINGVHWMSNETNSPMTGWYFVNSNINIGTYGAGQVNYRARYNPTFNVSVERKQKTTNVSTTTIESKKVLASEYLSTSVIPAPTMRARTIAVTGLNFKPFTEINLFLGDESVDYLFTPATIVVITNATGKYEKYIGSNKDTNNAFERRTENNSYDTLDYGEVVTWNGGSGVLLSDETVYVQSTGGSERRLYIVNVKGNAPVATDVMLGSISAVTSTVTSTVSPVLPYSTIYNTWFYGYRYGFITPNPLATVNFDTNSLGNIYGTLSIPGMTFNAGTLNFVATDNKAPISDGSQTYGETSYTNGGRINLTTLNKNYETTQYITTKNVKTNLTVRSDRYTYNPYWN